MVKKTKQLSNPFSSGGGGGHFEAHVQASFVALMLTRGYAPCMPCWPITEIKLQGKIEGFDTDDLIVFVEQIGVTARHKFVAQVKHSIHITQNDATFAEVMRAAWSDFNNELIFDRQRDVLALVTGPLNATDFHNVAWLLDQARHTKDADEFFRNVEKSHFSPPKSSEKLRVIQHHLKRANGGVTVPAKDLYGFLNRFRLLGYDLGKEMGVALSLLHSHIGQFNQQYPEWAWSRIVDIVQTWNQGAGTITIDRLPEDLKTAFKPTAIVHIPPALTQIESVAPQPNWNAHQYAAELALAMLVGSWNEKTEADASGLATFVAQDYLSWVSKLRDVLLLPNSPLSLRNGIWEVLERTSMWELLGPRIFDQHLDLYRQLIGSVLIERNPAFDLPGEERYAAAIHNKGLAHSRVLRTGLAEGLALIGARSTALVNCSSGKAEATAVLAVRDLFATADWTLWGSLNNLLPLLAEAAPDEFLTIVETSLQANPCPFDELFSQEGRGVTGSNYMTGLLWALEAIAWDEGFLVRACVALGDLADHDPGGNWSNRPSNSLTKILLPWKPQTTATIEKRKVAVEVVCRERPDVGWKLLLTLLPDQSQMTSDSYKPKWRIPVASTDAVVTQGEYWQQIATYAELAVKLAGADARRLCELIDRFPRLPKAAGERLLGVLVSEAISYLSDEQKVSLWDRLQKLINKHRRFSTAAWAMNADLLERIESIRDKITPISPAHLFQYLFTDNDHDLFEESGNWEAQCERLQDRRKKAIEDILELGGVAAVIVFAEAVRSPRQVGQAWGSVADEKADVALLPQYLRSENRKLTMLTDGYVWSRHFANGWSWADDLDKSGWSVEDVGQFLSFLPFTNEAWSRAEQWLVDAQGEYWSRANVNPYQTDAELSGAIAMLVHYGRPHAAIDCLVKMGEAKKPIDSAQAIRALMAAVSSRESSYTMDGHRIVELIKLLQTDSQVSPDDLFSVEWAYVQLLDRHEGGSPVILHRRLASDPEFFCELVRLIYRSNFEIANSTSDSDSACGTGVEERAPSEHSTAIASNAWRLLHDWGTPPGVGEDGAFNATHFAEWLSRVKESCARSGHLEVALITIGEVLVHTPPDGDGLWINRAVADALNARDAEDMRDGYRTGAYNSRGVHWVDPTGKPERELGEQYRKKADDVENAGYQRFAATLRGLAESYEQEAKRGLVDRH